MRVPITETINTRSHTDKEQLRRQERGDEHVIGCMSTNLLYCIIINKTICFRSILHTPHQLCMIGRYTALSGAVTVSLWAARHRQPIAPGPHLAQRK
jgi:hypothetical protein